MSQEYETLISEVKALKAHIAVMQTAMQNLASVQQLKQLMAIRQTDINNLENRVESVEQDVELLKGNKNV